jgi:hypothetical protein
MTVLNNANVKQCKKCDFHLGKGDLIKKLWYANQMTHGKKKCQNMQTQLINMNLQKKMII